MLVITLPYYIKKSVHVQRTYNFVNVKLNGRRFEVPLIRQYKVDLEVESCFRNYRWRRVYRRIYKQRTHVIKIRKNLRKETNLSRNLPCSSHYRRIAAIAGSSSLTSEHVKIVAFVLPLQKAIRTQRHTRRYTTCTTPICHELSSPNQSTSGRIVVLFHWK